MDKTRGETILYVFPGLLSRADGSLHLSARSVEALALYAQLHDGPVVVTGQGVQERAPLPEEVALDDTLPFAVIDAPSAVDAVLAVRPAVVLALLHQSSEPLLGLGVPVVLLGELTRRTRADTAIAGTAGTLRRARIVAGSWRVEHAHRKLVEHAAGVQANGPAAWEAYGRRARHGLMFHDHRIGDADVARAAASTRAEESVFRVAFSGRLIASKGAHLLPQIARELERRAPQVEIVVLGAGQFERELRRVGLPNLAVEGFKDFRAEWIPYVRDHVDMVLMPHLQGDPSCTYFEAWGSGAPVIGFHNETLTPVIDRHGCGWAVPRGDVSGLVARIASLAERPPEYAAARRRGLELIAEHSFEAESRRRVAMLQEVASRK